MSPINHYKTTICKKTIGAVLAAGCFSLLTGCGAKAPADTVVADGRVQVTLWYSGGKTAAGVMEEIIDSFNQSQNQYTVTGIQQADYDETPGFRPESLERMRRT